MQTVKTGTIRCHLKPGKQFPASFMSVRPYGGIKLECGIKKGGEWFSPGVKYDITVFLSTRIDRDACSECLHKHAGTNTHERANIHTKSCITGSQSAALQYGEGEQGAAGCRTRTGRGFKTRGGEGNRTHKHTFTHPLFHQHAGRTHRVHVTHAARSDIQPIKGAYTNQLALRSPGWS